MPIIFLNEICQVVIAQSTQANAFISSWLLSFLAHSPCNANSTKCYTYNSLRFLVFVNNAGGISSKWLLLKLLEVTRELTQETKILTAIKRTTFLKCIKRSFTGHDYDSSWYQCKRYHLMSLLTLTLLKQLQRLWTYFHTFIIVRNTNPDTFLSLSHAYNMPQRSFFISNIALHTLWREAAWRSCWNAG